MGEVTNARLGFVGEDSSPAGAGEAAGLVRQRSSSERRSEPAPGDAPDSVCMREFAGRGRTFEEPPTFTANPTATIPASSRDGGADGRGL